MTDSVDTRPHRGQLMDLINGYRVTQMIAAVAELGIADLLADGARDLDSLAQDSGSNASALGRVLRALIPFGFCSEDAPNRFRLSPMGQLLRTGVPGSLRHHVRYVGLESTWRAWGHLVDSVRTGESAFRTVWGMSSFEYRMAHEHDNEVFNAMLTEATSPVASPVAEAYPFHDTRLVVDVGGGEGALIAGILRSAPNARGILFDQPHVVGPATALLDSADVLDRCQIVGGNFFDAVPSGGDCYVLSRVIHDWNDERAVAILASCRRAIAPTGRLLLVEQVIPADPIAAGPARLGDMMMLVMPGGQERTEEEFRQILAAAQFRLTQVIPVRPPLSIVEAVPA